MTDITVVVRHLTATTSTLIRYGLYSLTTETLHYSNTETINLMVNMALIVAFTTHMEFTTTRRLDHTFASIMGTSIVSLHRYNATKKGTR